MESAGTLNRQGFWLIRTPRDSLHRLSSPTSELLRFHFSGHEKVSFQQIAERITCRFGDSDARSYEDAACAISIFAEPKAAGRRREIAAVVPSARNAERLAQATWAAGELGQIFRACDRDTTRLRHFFDACQWLQSTKENAPGLAFRLA